MARGVPDDHVTLQRRGGATRTFPFAEVSDAGKARDDRGGRVSPGGDASPPPAPPYKPYATIHANSARVALRSTEPGMTFHLQTVEATFEQAGQRGEVEGFVKLCTAPCRVEVPAGFHRLALSPPDGARRDIGIASLARAAARWTRYS